MVPSDCGGIDKALHRIGCYLHELAPSLDQRRIGIKAILGEQKYLRLESALLLDGKRFRSDVALHRGVFVRKKRLRIESIRLHLRLVEAIVGLQPLKVAG